MLSGLPNVSYAEAELIPAKNETEEKYIVHKIKDKKTEKGTVFYLVQWKKYPKKIDWTWQSKNQLLEDGLIDYIQQYEDEIKKKTE